MIQRPLNLKTSAVRGNRMLEPKYGYSPIIEVVCEFRFEPGEPWDLTVPGLVYQKLKDVFPKKVTRSRLDIDVPSTGRRAQRTWFPGNFVQFQQPRGKALVQLARNLISVNHLKPYPKWEKFLPLIRLGYDAYCEVASPAGLRRVGLRYINRIELPGKTIEFEDYFDFRPFLGAGLPQDFVSFLLAVETPFEDERDILRLQFRPDSEQPESKSAVVLDLDYILVRPKDITLDKSFDWLEEAHGHLETAFEGCITDKLRELFRKKGAHR